MELLCAAYLSVGAVIGLVIEEGHHQHSSDGFRLPWDYVFSAFVYACVWPLLFIDRSQEKK